MVSGERGLHASLSQLLDCAVGTLAGLFGAFLIVEIWAAERTKDGAEDPAELLQPKFRLRAPKDSGLDSFVGKLESALSRAKVSGHAARVEVIRTARCWPRQLLPLLPPERCRQLGCSLIGLEVEPIYRDRATGEPYPIVLRDLRHRLSRALRRAFFDFSRTRTTHQPAHFHMLGRRAVVKAVWEVDRRLAEVSSSFDFLLQATPVNAHQAWSEFRKSRFEQVPVLHYRPLPLDPLILKRRLYDTPVERVEDPTLFHLFREKLDELDRQITMLMDINKRTFVHHSIQMYGEIDDELTALANQLLYRLPSRSRDDSKGGHYDATKIAQLAQEEIGFYRSQWPQVDARVELRDDIASGLMTSRGSLLVNSRTKIPAARAEALLQHEVGTHVLTYYNGRAQPFQQLYCGLAGYEALQEGLAVLSEYLVGGLSRPRVRLLAARVLAARHMVDGATFIDTFRELDRTYDFERRTAFNTTLRVFRGGGLTKDVTYLRGLCQILEYLRKNDPFEPLFVGKIAVGHIGLIRELQYRDVLHKPPLQPRYMTRPDSLSRLEKLRNGMTVFDLIDAKRE
jgi:uncharacterized protein (TIGR02421 family)